MSVEGVSITAGERLSLKSSEADIELAGSLDVRVGASARGDRQLELFGRLEAQGGTYRLSYEHERTLHGAAV
jgi:hypothetical protein